MGDEHDPTVRRMLPMKNIIRGMGMVMTIYIAAYLIVGIIISGDFVVWERRHCPEPNDVSVADAFVIATAYPLIVAIAFVVYYRESEIPKRCTR